MKIIRKLISKLIPSWLCVFYHLFYILAVDYGQFFSQRSSAPVDGNRRPTPWYTYPSLEFIEQFNYSDKTVFEWGTGNSTLFWANRAHEVFSVEDDESWFHKTSCMRPDNVSLFLEHDKEGYTNRISLCNRRFDVIVIDGSYRYDCAQTAPGYLKRNGLIILDNSERYPGSCSVLRNHGFLQIDFSGFGPLSGYNTWCTSLFITGDFDFARLRDKICPVGGIVESGDENA